AAPRRGSSCGAERKDGGARPCSLRASLGSGSGDVAALGARRAPASAEAAALVIAEAAALVVAEAPTLAPFAALALHHRGGAFFQRLHAHREEADDVLVDAHVALHLLDRRGGRVEVEEHVMPFAVLLDAEGEVAQAPIFLLGDLAALLLDDLDEAVRQAVHLGRRNILARDEHALVVGQILTPSGCYAARRCVVFDGSTSRPGLAGNGRQGATKPRIIHKCFKRASAAGCRTAGRLGRARGVPAARR